MTYPSDREIIEYFAKLAPEVKEEFGPLLEEAQGVYRRTWQQDPTGQGRLDALRDFAAAVFTTRAAKRLRTHSGTFDAFRTAISLEEGDAELAFWYAHRLYNLVERGRMPFLWHREIQSHLWERIREAENLWYTPDLVPPGWEPLIGRIAERDVDCSTGGQSSDIGKPRKSPAEYFEAYRARHPTMSYRVIAARMGISYDALFRIKGEKAWVRDFVYEAAAGELGCHAEDLHPCNLRKLPRRKRTAPKRPA